MFRQRRAHEALEPLSELDWSVIDAARVDGRLSLNPHGVVARCLRLAGVNVPRPLANEELEALRRFAVRAWYWNAERQSDVCAFYAAGYSTTHAKQILAHIGARRGWTPSMKETSDASPRLPAVG